MYMSIDEIEQELGVMQLSDSFFPTGIFATSNGLEFLFKEKKIQGMTDLIEIIKTNIIQQIGPTDCVALANVVDGANKNDFHIGGIDLNRDVQNLEYVDLRMVESGEPCPSCSKPIEVFKAIELGHIFKLGTKYSESLGANFLDENGKENPIIMGSYGIGVDRVLACYLEQNNDENGIVWKNPLAPFDVHLIGLNMKKEAVITESENIYKNLSENGFEVLFDDRRTLQAGFKFSDADLIGLPVQIIVGERGLKENQVELKIRATGERMDVKLDELTEKIKKLF